VIPSRIFLYEDRNTLTRTFLAFDELFPTRTIVSGHRELPGSYHFAATVQMKISHCVSPLRRVYGTPLETTNVSIFYEMLAAGMTTAIR
jgi:hypothetical protein